MSTLYCIGEVCMTLSPALPQADSLETAVDFRAAPGGAAAELAAAYARQGGQAALLARLGDDPFGQRLTSGLKAQGVDVSGVELIPGGASPVLFDSPETSVFHPGELFRFPPEELDLNFLSDASGLVFTGTGLQDCPLRYAQLRAVNAARDAGVPVSFLPAVRSALWPSHEILRQTLLAFLARADLLFLSEEELELLYGTRELRVALFPLFSGPARLIACAGADKVQLVTREHYAEFPASRPLPEIAATVLTQLKSEQVSLAGISRWNPSRMERMG